MPKLDDVAVATRLGELTAAHDRAEAAAEAVHLLLRVMPADAVCLVRLSGHSTVPGTSLVVADVGYQPSALDSLAREFPRTPWMSMVQQAPMPPSLSREPAASYRDGWFFQERLAPIGYRDGMSGHLTTGSSHGVVHLSSERVGAFTDDRREVLGLLLRPLSVLLADHAPCRPRQQPADRHDGTGQHTGDAAPAVALTDPRVAAVVAALPLGSRLTFWWWGTDGLYRVSASRGSEGHPVVSCQGPRPALPFGLTLRELQVLTVLAAGHPQAQVASILRVSLRTVHSHVEHLRHRLTVSTTTAAVALALREGLLTLAVPTTANELVAALATRS